MTGRSGLPVHLQSLTAERRFFKVISCDLGVLKAIRHLMMICGSNFCFRVRCTPGPSSENTGKLHGGSQWIFHRQIAILFYHALPRALPNMLCVALSVEVALEVERTSYQTIRSTLQCRVLTVPTGVCVDNKHGCYGRYIVLSKHINMSHTLRYCLSHVFYIRTGVSTQTCTVSSFISCIP